MAAVTLQLGMVESSDRLYKLIMDTFEGDTKMASRTMRGWHSFAITNGLEGTSKGAESGKALIENICNAASMIVLLTLYYISSRVTCFKSLILLYYYIYQRTQDINMFLHINKIYLALCLNLHSLLTQSLNLVR